MDQNIRSAGSKLTVAILGFCFFPCLILGIGMLSGFANEMRWAGLLLILCAILLGFSAISVYRASKKEKEIANKQVELASREQQTPAVLKEVPDVLSHWHYSVSEWKTFLKWETKKQRRAAVVETILIFLFTALAIQYLNNGNCALAILISFVLGILYGSVKFFLLMRSIRWNKHGLPQVIITSQTILVNGHMSRFYGNNLWLEKVIIRELRLFNLFEVTYCWDTGKGKTYKEIRVPIPKGSLVEAVILQEKLMSVRF